MGLLAVLIAVVLLVLAALHMVWGLRIWWPLDNERALARAVVGAKDIEKMPSSLACFLVTGALAAIALLALMLGGLVSLPVLPNWLLLLAGLGSAAVMVLRGLAGFAPFWARMAPEEPFRTYDRRYYSPLCLLLGSGLFALVFAALSTTVVR